MSENLRLARLYLLLLAIFTVGRWVLGVQGVPYEKAHQVFSIVIMTRLAAFFYAAFCRRWRSYRLLQAVGLGMLLGLMSQVVILLATVLSYALGMETFFNHPTALNVNERVAMGQAMVIRAGGLVVNVVLEGITAALGWAMGALLPAGAPAAAPRPTA